MSKFIVALFLILATALTALGFYLAALDDSANQLALVALQPVAGRLIKLGNILFRFRGENMLALLPVIIVALVVTGVRFKKPGHNLFALGLILAFTAQWALINQNLIFALSQGAREGDAVSSATQMVIGCSMVGYALALLCFYAAFRKEQPRESLAERGVSDSSFTLRDGAVLLGIFLVALFFRLYAINHIFNSFEGEVASYSAGATSLEGMFLANKGVSGPWSPLGILYYLPIYLTTKLFGTTLLALRMSSALVGVFTIPLMYLLARRIGGKQVGFIAAMLLALNALHIGWGRTDIYPHGVTTWPVLLLCWLLIRAADTRKVIDAVWVALVMGLTWHQYPSGQSSVAIPVFAIGIYWLVNRFKSPLRGTQLAWVGVGVLLWLIGLPLSYYCADKTIIFMNPFNLTGRRALWGEVEGGLSTFQIVLMVINKASQQFYDVLQGIFYKVPYLFHQDFIPFIPDFHMRTVAWMIVPFVCAGLFIVLRSIRSFESAVIIAWLMAAILPGIMSEHAYPKRLSTFFPALDLLAALAIALYLAYARETKQRWRRVLAKGSVLACFALSIVFGASAWFSGRDWKYGEPPEVFAAAEMAKEIQPKTIIIADLLLGYHVGKMTYLLLDALTDPKNRPNFWFAGRVDAIRVAIKDPLHATKLDNDWIYIWTKLRNQKEESDAFAGWERVVFMIQERPENQDYNKDEIEEVMNRCANPVVRRIESRGTFWLPLVIVSCKVSNLR